MATNASSVFSSRLAVAITSVIVTTVVIAGGIAAASVANNSVNSAKIVNNSVRSIDIRNNDVTSADIRNNGVQRGDLALNATRVRLRFASEENQNLTGTNSNQIIETVTITAPSTGRLMINGGFKPDATVTDTYSCHFHLDGALMGGSDRTAQTENGLDTSCETSDGASVTAGTYTVDLIGSGVSNSNVIDDWSLEVLFVPGN